jgi:cytoskeletal protein RodZ
MFEIGSSLREARTRQGLAFEEMELRTKVRARYLRFLEEERFDALPGHTYTKGFLRVYADALGLDGRLFVDEYNSRHVGGDDEHHQPRTPRARPRDPRRDRRARSGESRTIVVALAGILLTTLLVIAAWKFGGSDAPPVEGVDKRSAATTPTQAPQRLTLVVKAIRGASYMEVRSGDASRAPLYTGTLEQGQAQRFNRKTIELYVAKPKNVILRVDGQPRSLGPDGRLSLGAAASVR